MAPPDDGGAGFWDERLCFCGATGGAHPRGSADGGGGNGIGTDSAGPDHCTTHCSRGQSQRVMW